MRPSDLVEAVERAIADTGDVTPHVDELLDNFYRTRSPTERSAMIKSEPQLIGNRFSDAYVGGVGEHLARRWSLAIPNWVRNDRRYLTSAIFHPDIPGRRRWMMVVTPIAFRVRLVFTGPEPLQRARFPYAEALIDRPEGGAYEELAVG